MTAGLANLCKGVSIPPMTVPFNLIDLLIFICLPTAMKHFAPDIDNSITINNTFASNFTSIELLHNSNNGRPAKVDWMMVTIHLF